MKETQQVLSVNINQPQIISLGTLVNLDIDTIKIDDKYIGNAYNTELIKIEDNLVTIHENADLNVTDFNLTGNFKFGGQQITANTSEINILDANQSL